MKEFYNHEIKKEFLLRYNENSRVVIERVFLHSYSSEKAFDKDLYDFTLNEISEVIYNLSPLSTNISRSLVSYISSYIKWAIENGLRKSNINPLDGLGKDFYNKFVNKSKKIHWSDEEIYEIIEKLANPQDQALILLLFNGIMGEKFIELSRLKFTDIDFNTGEINVYNRDTKITLFNKEQDLPILEKAYDQKIYLEYDKDNLYKEFTMIDSPFLFKNIISKKIQDTKEVTRSVFYTRLKRIQNDFGFEYFTPNALRQSGMIKMAVDLWKEYGKLEKEEFNLIGDRFNLNKMKSSGYEYYNRHMMKNYINEENIKELYGIDVVVP